MAVRIIARKIGDDRLEAGDIITVRDGSHQWTPTEQAQIGKRWVEIVVDQDPPNSLGYYRQPLATLEISARDGTSKDVSNGKQVVLPDVTAATFPWDGELTPDYEMVKGGQREGHRHNLVKQQNRRFRADVSEITDRVEFKTWADFEATLTDKRGQ